MPLRARALALASFLAVSAVLGAVPGSRPEPVAAAAPKVAILVGPTAITDSHYLPSAKQLRSAAQAAGAIVDLRYCPTPGQAKAAAAGASIIVYFGHGNGFPNPYSGTELTDRVNGWGLRNPSKTWNRESCTDSVLRYYGEDYLTGKITGNGWPAGGITPAANFVMVYSNACYAPGAGEARPAPSKGVAVQRVSNYSTPILQMGGTYFATDLGSTALVDLLLRNRSTSFGTLFTMGNGYSEDALRRVAHLGFPSKETWVHRTSSQWLGDDYWYAFAGNPGKAPDGSNPGFSSTVGLDLPFDDIADSKFVDEIVWLADTGITTGCADRLFCPTQVVSRSQMATFLSRAFDLGPATRDWFGDDDHLRHEDHINRLAEAGITEGCGPGQFCPNGIVSRAEMAAFLNRALDLPPATRDWFSDDNGMSLEPEINAFAEAGLTRGCGSGTFCPTTPVTRAELAAFLYRALGS